MVFLLPIYWIKKIRDYLITIVPAEESLVEADGLGGPGRLRGWWLGAGAFGVTEWLPFSVFLSLAFSSRRRVIISVTIDIWAVPSLIWLTVSLTKGC